MHSSGDAQLSAPVGSTGDPHKPGVVLASTSLGTLLVILLTSGLNIALPAIRDTFAASPSTLAWVLSGYTLAFAMFTLAGGALVDCYGPRRVYFAGLAIFAVASSVAAAAPSIVVLIVGTFGQGLGAAFVLPSALSLIQLAYQGRPERLAWAIGMWAGANALGAAVGPVICGAIVSLASWRTMFVLVVVLAVVFGVAGASSLPRNRGAGGSLDMPGLVTLVILLGSATLLAHEVTHVPPLAGAVMIAVIIVAAALFVVVERRSSTPMLPLEQLRDTAFDANAVVTVVGTAGFFGALYIASQALQDELGMSAFVAGVALLPLAFGNIVAALAAGRVIGRLGVRGAMILGSILLVAGLVPLSLLFTNYAALVVPLMIVGLGWGLLVPTTSAAGLARALAGRDGVASGVTAGGREFGAALAAATIFPLGVPGIWGAVGAGALSLVVVLIWVRDVDPASMSARSND